MKKVIGICLTIFVVAIFLVPSFAQADSFNFVVEADKYEVEPGETVIVALKLKDIDAGDLGINTVEGMLSYDETVFEKVSKESFTDSNGWSLKYNDEETDEKGKFLGILLKIGTKENQEIGKIKLKVKERIMVSETTIRITDIATNNEKELIKDSDKEVTLKIKNISNDKEQIAPANDNNQQTTIINNYYQQTNSNNINNNSQSNINNNSDNSNNSNKSQNNSIIDKIKEKTKNIDLTKFPETGTGRMIIYVIIIVLLIIVNLLISYIRTGKKKKKKIIK